MCRRINTVLKPYACCIDAGLGTIYINNGKDVWIIYEA